MTEAHGHVPFLHLTGALELDKKRLWEEFEQEYEQKRQRLLTGEAKQGSNINTAQEKQEPVPDLEAQQAAQKQSEAQKQLEEAQKQFADAKKQLEAQKQFEEAQQH